MFDEFLEITGIGPFPIYRIWRKRPIREDVRMLQMDRIARARHWLVTQWNANARMTVTERVELRLVQRMMQRLLERQWRLTVYGVSEVVWPVKLLWPERPGKDRWCIEWVCSKKVLANRMVCPWCGSWNGEREWRMQPLEFPAASIEAQMHRSWSAEYLKEILGDS